MWAGAGPLGVPPLRIGPWLSQRDRGWAEGLLQGMELHQQAMQREMQQVLQRLLQEKGTVELQ